jgi:hypothetical protein
VGRRRADGFWMRCWCGEIGWFSNEVFDEPCGGLGILHCHCGGDLCVCHWHGETQCDGCVDCREADEYDDDGEGWPDAEAG